MALATLRQMNGGVSGQFREAEFKKWFEYRIGAPTDWAAERGATHTLFCAFGEELGARVLKSVVYVLVDEAADGSAVWEKWSIRHHRPYGT